MHDLARPKEVARDSVEAACARAGTPSSPSPPAQSISRRVRPSQKHFGAPRIRNMAGSCRWVATRLQRHDGSHPTPTVDPGTISRSENNPLLTPNPGQRLRRPSHRRDETLSAPKKSVAGGPTLRQSTAPDLGPD